MQITESQLRQIIREKIINENLAGFADKTSNINYTRSSLAPKADSKDVKRIWATEADHTFMNSLVKVHWISGIPGSFYNVFGRLNTILTMSGKDEIATMGYIDHVSPSRWGDFGVMVQGRTTLAANDMNAISSGYHREMDPEDVIQYRKTSGVPKRATLFNSKLSKLFVLDAESFVKDDKRPLGNELIVDNWKPVGLVAPRKFLRTLKTDAFELGPVMIADEVGEYQKLVRLFATSQLTVYYNTGEVKDMSQIKVQ